MIMRIAGAADACVAVHVSENREADSGCSGGFNVRPSWRMAARTFGLAGIRGKLPHGIAHIRCTANQRLRQIVRIDDGECPLQVWFFQRNMFNDCCTETRRHAIAPNETIFEMGGGDLQRVALKLSAGEAIPGMLRIW